MRRRSDTSLSREDVRHRRSVRVPLVLTSVPVSSPAFVRAVPAVIDVLLLLMAVIWGTNYSIVKHAFREIDPQAFNALRMSIASLIFLTVILVVRARASGAALRTRRRAACSTRPRR